MYKHITSKFVQTSSIVSALNIVKSRTHCSSLPPEFRNDPKFNGYISWSRSFCTKEPGTIEKLFSKLASKSKTPNNKITVVGSSALTAITAFTLLAKNVTNEVCLIDVNDDRLRSEQMDLQFGSMHLHNAKIIASKDHAASADSKICVITAGTQRGNYEDCKDFVEKNAGILQAVITPVVVKNSPNAIIIVASEPVDVLSHLAWKVSGLPKNRVLGTGTSIDTARFRYLLAERLGVAAASCHGYVIGEHGENSVPLWSSVNVAGVRLADINPHIGTASDPEKWQDIHKKVVSSEGLVRQLKGADSWAMALTISNLCDAILSNSNTVHPVSTYAKGEHRIIDDVFLSLPCVLGSAGVTAIVRQKLTEHEIELLRKSGESIFRRQEYTKLMA